jgi:murein L,D-transpeptidase YcbB/YkuD
MVGLALAAGLGPQRVAQPGAEAMAAPALRLVLNIPAYRLDVFENGELTRSYPVAVGAASYPTPVGSYTISRVEWNPWWRPPQSGWARGKQVTPPGPGNPMGRVKLYFMELYYLHGTPVTGSIGEAASHGCVRLLNEDAIELARLVHEYASPGVTSSQVDAILADSRRTRVIGLARPVPLEVRYDVAEVREGDLVVHPDVYGWTGAGGARERALQALAAAGVTAGRVRDARLAEVLSARRGSQSVSVPITELTWEPLGEPLGEPVE